MIKNNNRQLHPFGHGGDLRTAAEAAGIAADELLDFSASINPLGAPPGLFAFLAERLCEVKGYPDPACRSLCAAIRRRFAVATGEIVPGNGAGELIYLFMRVIPPGPALIPAPTFSLYEKAAKAAGREVSYHFMQQRDDFALNTASFCREIARMRPAIAVLCNPNNPTGSVLDRQEILEIAQTCSRAGTFLLLDEAFLEFCPDWGQRTMLGLQRENVAVLYSLTKMYAMPGLRLGFLTADENIAAAIHRLRDPWSVNTLAQLAGEYVLRDREFVRRTAEDVRVLTHRLAAGLSELPGLRVWPSTVNYLFVESKLYSSRDLQHKLLNKGVLVRDCSNFRGLGDGYFRVAVRTAEENSRLCAALAAVLRNGGEQ